MNIIYPLIGAFSNWFFRGGGMESSLLKGKNFSYGKPINAIIFGFFCLFSTHEWWMLPSGAIAMLIGQAPKWGEYIGAMNGDNNKGFRWGVCAMTLRGLFWSLMLAIPFAFYNIWVAFFILLAGLPFGMIYGFLIILAKTGKWKQTVIFNAWTCSEMATGFVLWLPLSFI